MKDAFRFASESFLNPNDLLGVICYGALYLALALGGIRLVRAWGRRLASHPGLIADATTANFIVRLLQLACALVALTAYAHTVPALYKMGTALLASAGVLSIVLGLAAQNTLGNLIAGIALIIYRPFAIGDVLVLSTPGGRETGTVREFSLGYTKLQTEDGRWVIAPNSVMIASVLVRLK